MIIPITYALFIIGLLIIIAGAISIRASYVRVFMFQNITLFRLKMESWEYLKANSIDMQIFISDSPDFFKLLFSRKRLTIRNFYTQDQIAKYF